MRNLQQTPLIMRILKSKIGRLIHVLTARYEDTVDTVYGYFHLSGVYEADNRAAAEKFPGFIRATALSRVCISHERRNTVADICTKTDIRKFQQRRDFCKI